MLLSIVIVNFNARHVLASCLRSLEESGDWMQEQCEVFVVDNASSDGSAAFIRSAFPWVNLIENAANVGFATANNLALRRAAGRYLLILNPDTVVPRYTLARCVAFLEENPGVGVLTCRVEFPDGRIDIDCHRGVPTPWASFTYFSGLERSFPASRLFGKYHMTYCSLEETHDIAAAVGAFMMMPAFGVEDVGLLDERFFFYGEDLDWCYRFRQRGWRVVYFPEVKIIHHKGVSSGIRTESQAITSADAEGRERSALASVEAMRLFFDKHLSHRYPRCVRWAVDISIEILKRQRLRRARRGPRRKGAYT